MSNENSTKVAEAAVARLVEAGLVVPTSAETLRIRIAGGSMKQEDWRLELEKALKSEKKS